MNMGITKMNGAKWIGIENKSNITQEVFIDFKNNLKLNELVNLEICITANNCYKLWVNNVYITAGPCKGDNFRQFFDVVDISKSLKIGNNIIAVEVMYYKPSLYGDSNKIGPMNTVTNILGPMLALRGECIDRLGNVIADITTGKANWKYHINDNVKWQVPGTEYGFIPIGALQVFYGKENNNNWKIDESDDLRWFSVINKYDTDGSAWGGYSPLPLVERTIPLMYSVEKSFNKEMNDPNYFSNVDKILVPPNTKTTFEMDAGELTNGFFRLHTLNGEGSKIKVTYAECYSGEVVNQYREKGRRDDNINYTLFGISDEFFPSKGENIFETFSYRTFRFIKIEVETNDSSIVLYKPSFRQTGYPLEVKACFKSCFDWTKYLWDTSLRTLTNCMHDTYIDCPYYERLQYAMDTRLEILFTYMVSGDTRLAKKAIEDFYSSFTPYGLMQARAPSDEASIIPVFSLYWIFMLHDYYWQTGDINFLKRYRPAIDSILDWFESKMGEYDLTQGYYYWEFTDWVEAWQNKEGQLTAISKASEIGASSTNNLLYAMALQYSAEIMKITERDGLASEYSQRADAILKSVEMHCWDEKMGLYREGPKIEEYTQHAQALAVLTHLAKKDKAEMILKNSIINTAVHKCTYAFSYYLFSALEESNLYYLTNNMWDKWREGQKLNLTTFPEDFTRSRSDCHGWSALPLYGFTRNILGVKPLKAGWKEIEIRPQCNYIDEFSGKVPIPSGEVIVKIKKDVKGYKICGSVPFNIPFRVVFPDGQSYTFEHGGGFNI